MVLLIGFFRVSYSQDNSNYWKLIDNKYFSVQVPNQNIRNIQNKQSLLKTFLGRLNPTLADAIIDSISLQSGNEHIRCDMDISKCKLTKHQTDSIAPIIQKYISDNAMTEFKNVESEIRVQENSTLILVSFDGIKEHMTILVWICNNYAISVSLEDASKDYEMTKYLIENLTNKE